MTDLTELREAVDRFQAWQGDDAAGYYSLIGISCDIFAALPALLDEVERLKAENEQEATEFKADLSALRADLAAMTAKRDALFEEATKMGRDLAAARAAEETAFKAGYHCQWLRDEGRYIFDPAMKPGDPDGAWLAYRK